MMCDVDVAVLILVLVPVADGGRVMCLSEDQLSITTKCRLVVGNCSK